MAGNEVVITRINNLISKEDYENAFEECQKLKETISKEDNLKSTSITRTLASLAIKCERFKYALNIIKENNLEHVMIVDFAYCLYRIGRYSEAVKLINGFENKDLPEYQKLQIILAQVFYRMNKFEDAADIYDGLSGNDLVDANMLDTNYWAADYGQSCSKSEYRELYSRSNKSSSSYPNFDDNDFYSILFNKAQIFYMNCNFSESLKAIEKSIETAKETLRGNGYEEDEILDELVPMLSLRSLVNTKLGNFEDANQDLLSVLSSSSSTIKRLAQFNLKALALNLTIEDIKDILNEKTLSKFQRPHVMLNLAFKIENPKKRVKILRKIIKYADVHPLATMLLYDTLIGIKTKDNKHADSVTKGECLTHSDLMRMVYHLIDDLVGRHHHFVQETQGTLGIFASSLWHKFKRWPLKRFIKRNRMASTFYYRNSFSEVIKELMNVGGKDAALSIQFLKCLQ